MLGHVLDICAALQHDQSRPLTERHVRDREIAQAQQLLPVPDSRSGQLRTLATWWRSAQTRPEFRNDGLTLQGGALDRARTVGSILLFLFGALLGAGVTVAALRYDGSAPVNLVSVLGVLVIVPGMMLLLTLLLLPGRVPGFGWLQDVLATISPGQWLSAWLNRRFANADLGWRGRLSRSAALIDAAPGGYRCLGKWQMLLYSQLLALGFFAASLAAIALLVTFSDLAFGWSTTLKVASESVAAWVLAVHAPWSQWLPAAAPSAELVAQSRFYRAAALTDSQVYGLGGWWPFLMAAVFAYGMLPRVLLAALAAWRLRRAEQQLLLDHPQVQRLLERLRTPAISHVVDVPESGAAPSLAQPPRLPVDGAASRYRLPEAATLLINWNGAVEDSALDAWLERALDRRPEQVLALGAQTTLAEEQQLLLDLQAEAVVVLTKSWEPPLLEFIDVAKRLKAALGNQGPVLLLPVGIGGAEPAVADLAIWQQTIAALDDVRIRVGATA